MKTQKSTAIQVFTLCAMLIFGINAETQAKHEGKLNSPIADQLPEFELSKLGENGEITRDSLKESYHLLYFWSVDCPISTREMPYMHELYWNQAGENFEIVSVSVDEESEMVESFIDRVYPMPWIHTTAGGQNRQLEPFVTAFELDSFPVKILISPEGEVIDITQGFGGKKYINKIEGLLADSEPA